MYVRNGGALILQLHIRHAGDAGTAHAQFAKLLSYVAILPWVKVAGLASQILGRIVRRLSADWQAKYGHPVFLVETFVERERFAGTAYQAANWRRVGQTQGRGRQGPDPRQRTATIKDVWVYPLHRHFRQRLQTAGAVPPLAPEVA